MAEPIDDEPAIPSDDADGGGDGGGDPNADAADDGGADAAADAGAEPDAGGDGGDGGDGAAVAAASGAAVVDYAVGDRVVWLGRYRGVVAFVGDTQFAPGTWVGVILDKPVGKNNGSVQGVSYFSAAPGTGIFLRHDVLRPYDEEEWAATTIESIWRGHNTLRAAAAAGGDGAESTTTAPAPKSILKSSPAAAAPAKANTTTTSTTSTTTTTFVGSSGRRNIVSVPVPQSFLPASPTPPLVAVAGQPPGYVRAGVVVPATAPIGVTTPRSGAPLHPYANVATKSERDTLPSESAGSAAAGRAASAASSTSSSPVPASAGGSHVIWVWGDNEKGELSIQPVNALTGPKRNCVLPTPMRVPSAAPIAQLSLGLHHTVALNTANDVFTCGEWVLGCLGHGDAVRKDLSTLRRLKRLGGGGGAAGADGAAASADDDGAASASSGGAVDPDKRIVQVSCGDTHCVALYASGELYTWGGSLYGKLGTTGSELKNKKVVRVDCGNWHTAVCTDKGSVYTFGGGGKNSNFGQLGHGDSGDSKSARKFKECPNPTIIQYFVTAKVFVKDICCGGFHTLALTDAGDVYSWGRGEFGQLGLGTDSNSSTPKLISTLHDYGRVSAISAGENHSLAAGARGELYSWGYGQQGQLGHASSKNEKIPRILETLVKGHIQVVQVACGWRHSLALSSDLEVYSWGYGDKGQLGLGDHSNKLVPCIVEALRGKMIKQIGAGGSHSLAANFPFQTTTEMYRLLDEWQRHKDSVAEREREQAALRIQQLQRQQQVQVQSAPVPQPPPPLAPHQRASPDVKQPPPAMRPAPAAVPLTPLNALSPLAARPAEQFIDDLDQPELSRSSALSGGAGPAKRVRVLYSDSVSLVHKFATFQSNVPYHQFEALIQGYMKRCYGFDAEVQFDDIVVTRTKQRSGSVRVTLMFVGTPSHPRELSNLDTYWPEWARTLWQLVGDERLCEGTEPGTGPGVDNGWWPTFRELRPIREKRTLPLDDDRDGTEINWFNADPNQLAALQTMQHRIDVQRQQQQRAGGGPQYFITKPYYLSGAGSATAAASGNVAPATGNAGLTSPAARTAYGNGGASVLTPPPAQPLYSYASPAATAAAAPAPAVGSSSTTTTTTTIITGGGGAAGRSAASSTIAAARLHLANSAQQRQSPQPSPRSVTVSSSPFGRKTTTTTTSSSTSSTSGARRSPAPKR